MTAISTIRWARTHPLGNLLPPVYAGDGGFDLVSVETVSIGPSNHGQGVVKVPCGIRLELPDHVNALILGRSNTILGGLLVVNTLVDAGYRGHIFVMVLNLNPIMTATVNPGDRLAQLFIMPLLAPSLRLEMVEQDQIAPSERGSQGFGSTGGVHSSVSTEVRRAPGHSSDSWPDKPNTADDIGRMVIHHVTDRGGLAGPEELPGA